jgi:protein TonB
MELYAKSLTRFPLSVLFAIIATTSMFVTLPLLTRLQNLPETRPITEPILINTRRPSPPPAANRDDPKTQTPPEKRLVEREESLQREKPKIDILRGVGIPGADAWINIGKPEFVANKERIPNPTYTPEEVDHAPRVLRSFPPQYPYMAQRDNIEGWVVLRFVVDTEGVAGKVSVVAADPEGLFEEAALKAVARYKFKPALKNGDAVNCIVTQRMQFSLD